MFSWCTHLHPTIIDCWLTFICFKKKKLLETCLSGIAERFKVKAESASISKESSMMLMLMLRQHEREEKKKKRAKINKEHKRKWPDNACCTIANKTSTVRQSEIWRQHCKAPCWLKYAFNICFLLIFQATLTWDDSTRLRLRLQLRLRMRLQLDSTRLDSLAQEIHLTCFDWSIRYTAPVFSRNNKTKTKISAAAPCRRKIKKKTRRFFISFVVKAARDLIWVHYFSVYHRLPLHSTERCCVWWNDDDVKQRMS